MAEIISFVALIKEIGYEPMVEVMVEQLGYVEWEARLILDYERGLVDSDIVEDANDRKR